MRHELKLNKIYFEEALNGKKPFEIRYNDRDYKVGDEIVLKEWDDGYTGREISGKITYILKSAFVGLARGYVAFTYEVDKKPQKTDEFTEIIDAFACDFGLAVEKRYTLSDLDEIIQNEEDPRHDRMLNDITSLSELSNLLRNGKAEIYLTC